MPVTYAIATHPGLVRSENEDALVARPPVFMVADGMGGAQAGEVASAAAAKAFAQFAPRGGEPAAELSELIVRVNSDIYRMAGDKSERAGMGTTVTAACLAGGSVSIAHVGDSRAYLWRGGRLEQLTEDHSLVGEMVRLGQISPEEMRHHPQRSIITRALGVEGAVEVDTRDIPLEPGDLFLLCSDGLHSLVPDRDIAAAISRNGDLSTIAGRLVEAANSRGGLDNITVVLFSPDGSFPAGTASPSGQEHQADTRTMPAAREEAGAPDTTAAAGKGSAAGRLYPVLGTRTGKIAAALAAAAVMLAGAWYGNRQVYYLGIENSHVAIYQGMPYSIGPLDLSSLYLESRVSVDDLEPYERERLSRHELRSLGEAEKILENYSAAARTRQEEKARGGATTGTTATVPLPPGGQS